MTCVTHLVQYFKILPVYDFGHTHEKTLAVVFFRLDLTGGTAKYLEWQS